MNERRPPRRSGIGLALPVAIVILTAGAVALFLAMPREERQPAPTGAGSGVVAPPKDNSLEGGPKSPGPEAVTDPKPKPGPAEVDRLLKLAGGDVRERAEALDVLRLMGEDGLSQDLAKLMVDHARDLIESGEKQKVRLGIKLIEVSGDYRQWEYLISTWDKHLGDKDIDFVVQAALGNLLQGHRSISLAKSHPEWSKDVVQKQAMRSATSSCMSCGSDPAKWRELWKNLLAEEGTKPDANPAVKPKDEPPASDPAK